MRIISSTHLQHQKADHKTPKIDPAQGIFPSRCKTDYDGRNSRKNQQGKNLTEVQHHSGIQSYFCRIKQIKRKITFDKRPQCIVVNQPKQDGTYSSQYTGKERPCADAQIPVSFFFYKANKYQRHAGYPNCNHIGAEQEYCRKSNPQKENIPFGVFSCLKKAKKHH